MADIAIFVGAIDKLPVGPSLFAADQFRAFGSALVSGQPIGAEGISWEVAVSHNSPAVVMNRVIKAAAITAVEAAGFTVSPADNKVIFAGAQDV